MKRSEFWMVLAVLIIGLVTVGCQKGQAPDRQDATPPTVGQETMPDTGEQDQLTTAAGRSAEGESLFSESGQNQKAEPRMLSPSDANARSEVSGDTSVSSDEGEEDEGDVKIGRMLKGLFNVAGSMIPGVSRRSETRPSEEAPLFRPAQP